MTTEGMEKMESVTLQKILADPRLKGRECALILSSRLSRALDAASVFAIALDTDIQTLEGLGQLANKEGDVVVKLPGHEHESFVEWQQNALGAVEEIVKENWFNDDEFFILTGHRPTIGGLVGEARGLNTEDELDKLVNNPELVVDGYVVVDVEENGLVITEVPLPDSEDQADSA